MTEEQFEVANTAAREKVARYLGMGVKGWVIEAMVERNALLMRRVRELSQAGELVELLVDKGIL